MYLVPQQTFNDGGTIITRHPQPVMQRNQSGSTLAMSTTNGQEPSDVLSYGHTLNMHARTNSRSKEDDSVKYYVLERPPVYNDNQA